MGEYEMFRFKLQISSQPSEPKQVVHTRPYPFLLRLENSPETEFQTRPDQSFTRPVSAHISCWAGSYQNVAAPKISSFWAG